MNTTTKSFADRLFAIGFRVAFKIFRRSPKQPAGAQSWLAATASPLSWEAALSGADQQAKQPLN